MLPTTLDQTLSEINAGITRGLHTGAVIHIRHGGEIIANTAVGFTDTVTRRPLSPDARMLLLSAGKPLTAAAVALLVQRGEAAFDDPVARFIPGFEANGKGHITLRHVLTHTHAWQPPAIDWPRLPWDEIINKIVQARVPEGRTAGNYAAYDPQTGWYILAEIIQRISGRRYADFVREEIIGPTGAGDLSIGMDSTAWEEAVASGDIIRQQDTTGSSADKTDLTAVASDPEKRLPHAWVGDDAPRAGATNPGGGALGTAAELGAFYQSMLDATGPLSRETIDEMTGRQRTGMRDESFRSVVDWGLGFLINSGQYNMESAPYGYGRYASAATFGHGGMQSVSAYADPENRLAVVIIFLGLCGEPKHQKRVLDVNSALYRDLGLATAS